MVTVMCQTRAHASIPEVYLMPLMKALQTEAHNHDHVTLQVSPHPQMGHPHLVQLRASQTCDSSFPTMPCRSTEHLRVWGQKYLVCNACTRECYTMMY